MSDTQSIIRYSPKQIQLHHRNTLTKFNVEFRSHVLLPNVRTAGAGISNAHGQQHTSDQREPSAQVTGLLRDDIPAGWNHSCWPLFMVLQLFVEMLTVATMVLLVVGTVIMLDRLLAVAYPTARRFGPSQRRRRRRMHCVVECGVVGGAHVGFSRLMLSHILCCVTRCWMPSNGLTTIHPQRAFVFVYGILDAKLHDPSTFAVGTTAIPANLTQVPLVGWRRQCCRLRRAYRRDVDTTYPHTNIPYTHCRVFSYSLMRKQRGRRWRQQRRQNTKTTTQTLHNI